MQDDQWLQYSTWSSKNLFLAFWKVVIHQYVHLTLHWPFVNLGIGTSALELESELILQTSLFPVPCGLWTPNLAGWWFRMRRPHPQSHGTLRHRGHVTNRKHYISTFTRSIDCKLSRLVFWDEGTPLTKSRDASITWPRDKSKTFYDHIHKVHDHQSLLGCWIRMRGPHPKSHVTLQLCGHMKKQKRHISSTKGLLGCKRKACARQK